MAKATLSFSKVRPEMECELCGIAHATGCEVHHYVMADGHCSCLKTEHRVTIEFGRDLIVLASSSPLPKDLHLVEVDRIPPEQLPLFGG